LIPRAHGLAGGFASRAARATPVAYNREPFHGNVAQARPVAAVRTVLPLRFLDNEARALGFDVYGDAALSAVRRVSGERPERADLGLLPGRAPFGVVALELDTRAAFGARCPDGAGSCAHRYS